MSLKDRIKRANQERKSQVHGSTPANLRELIDSFRLWECGDDADGYNVSADRLAQILFSHNEHTVYYFGQAGNLEAAIDWAEPWVEADAPIEEDEKALPLANSRDNGG